MNHLIRKTALAAAAVAAVMAAHTASANTYTASSDVLLEFSEVGAANDVFFDLGSASQFYSGSQTIDLSTIGYSASILNTAFGQSAYSSLSWALVSAVAGSPKGVIVTDEYPGGNVSAFQNNANAGTAATQINNQGNAYAAVAGANILSSTAVNIAQGNSKSFTTYGGGLNNSLNGDAAVINGNGIDSAYFEELDGTGAPQVLGSITFNEANGQMIYTAVPEPMTYGLLGGAGLLALALRRQFGRQKLA